MTTQSMRNTAGYHLVKKGRPAAFPGAGAFLSSSGVGARSSAASEHAATALRRHNSATTASPSPPIAARCANPNPPIRFAASTCARCESERGNDQAQFRPSPRAPVSHALIEPSADLATPKRIRPPCRIHPFSCDLPRIARELLQKTDATQTLTMVVRVGHRRSHTATDRHVTTRGPNLSIASPCTGTGTISIIHDKSQCKIIQIYSEILDSE